MNLPSIVHLNIVQHTSDASFADALSGCTVRRNAGVNATHRLVLAALAAADVDARLPRTSIAAVGCCRVCQMASATNKPLYCQTSSWQSLQPPLPRSVVSGVLRYANAACTVDFQTPNSSQHDSTDLLKANIKQRYLRGRDTDPKLLQQQLKAQRQS
jgi:hypothetical protein